MVKLHRLTTTLVAGLSAEIANKIFPLVIIHYAQSRLGMERFGYAQFGIYLVDLFLPVVVWGYQMLGSIRTGEEHGAGRSPGAFAGTLITMRLIHAVFATIALFALVYLVPEWQPYRHVVLALSFILFTGALDMTWLHVGTQRMAQFSLLTVAAKSASLVLILWLVQDPDDAVLYAALSFGANGLISLGTIVLSRRYLRGFRFSLRERSAIFRSAFPLGVGFLLIYFYDRLDLVIVETLAGMEGVGFYAGPLRLQQSLGPLVSMMGMVFFSEMVVQRDRKDWVPHVRSGLLAILAVILPVVCGIWFVDADLLALILGEDFRPGGNILAILVLTLIPHALITVFGNQILVLQKRMKFFNSALAAGVAGGLGAGYILGSIYGLVGVAVAMVLVKCLVAGAITIKAVAGMGGLPLPGLGRVVLPSAIMTGALLLLPRPGTTTVILTGALVYSLAFVLLNRELALRILRALRQGKPQS